MSNEPRNEKLELFIDLMLKQDVGLMELTEYIFKNRVNSKEYSPAFIDELKKRLAKVGEEMITCENCDHCNYIEFSNQRGAHWCSLHYEDKEIELEEGENRPIWCPLIEGNK